MRETQNEDPHSNSVGLTDHDRDKHGHVRVQDLGHRGENTGNTPFGSTGIGTVSHSNALEGTTRRQRPAEEDLGVLTMLKSTIDGLIAAETGDLALYRTMLNEIGTPEMLQAINEILEYSLGNEQERAKSAFGHASLQTSTKIAIASNARIEALKNLKRCCHDETLLRSCIIDGGNTATAKPSHGIAGGID